ncbi:fibrinogen-like protein A [Physella acuta]|uniref:fibrinogen-like protein A n=1 Tax=Physella acuta TaxID=109671 RepID=UPI0027DE0001|nr:fibrinogen-like protein A [Physella acuta]
MEILIILMIILQGHMSFCDSRSEKYSLKNTSELTLLPLDKTYTTRSQLMCAAKCAEKKNECYNYMYDTATKTCTLGYWLLPVSALNTSQQASTTRLYSKGMYCNVQELVTPVGNGQMSSFKTLACRGGSVNVGKLPVLEAPSPNVYRSCRDVKNSTNPRQLIKLASGLVVMCDTVTDGGGWTIFQRRVTGAIDFYRNWKEYKNGFGDYSIGDFYLGNENIYSLGLKYSHQMRFDMSYKGQSYYASYSTFRFASESQGYQMYLGGYSGTAGDSHLNNNNMRFSTYDVNNDLTSVNCAVRYHGAWWYNSCYHTHLNGKWASTTEGGGIFWLQVTGFDDNLESCEMKIRPLI